MLRRHRQTGFTSRNSTPDDEPVPILRRDASGGMNDRMFESIIGETQAVLLQNILLDTSGQRALRKGQTRVDSSYPSSPSSGYGLFGFDPDNGTFELLAIQSTNLSGNASGSFSTYKNDFTTSLQTTIIKAGMSAQNDIAIISNGTDNVFGMQQDHTMLDLGDTNTSPPKTTALTYYGNRVWALKQNQLSFSDAFPVDYSLAFDRTTNYFRTPCGTARALLSTRTEGIICMGADQIWGLMPSLVPDPVTDQPQKILEIGCAAANTAVQVADDIVFLAPDGVRGVFRTQLDKVQTGQSFPLSWFLKTEFENINWAHIDKACAVFFDNKYIISLPTGESTYPNQIWVYYPALSTAMYSSTNIGIQPPAQRCWTVYDGWNIARFAKLRINGLETLFGIDAVTGKVMQLFNGTDDLGNAIVYDEITRAEDFGQPMSYKMGGEFKVRALGGNGTLVVSANADGQGWTQLGTLDLSLSGVTFPTTFPVLFTPLNELFSQWHLDDAGIEKFKRVKFELYCDDLDAQLTVLEHSATAFVEPYISES